MLMWPTPDRQSQLVLHSLASQSPWNCATYGTPLIPLHKMWAPCHSARYFAALHTHSTLPVPCKQTPSIQHQYAPCLRGRRRSSSSRGEEEGKGWENKASIVVSPAGPGRAALAGASYVMWLAGPTSLFRAAAHTNPHRGTSPALEREEETEGELWENQWWRCDYKNFSLSSAPNRTYRDLPSQLLCWKITRVPALLTAYYSIKRDYFDAKSLCMACFNTYF